jgi:hypothetical protein
MNVFFVFIMLFYNCKDSNKPLISEESFVYNWCIQNEFRIDSFVLKKSKQKQKATAEVEKKGSGLQRDRLLIVHRRPVYDWHYWDTITYSVCG